jgi:hypothetical protein
MPSESTVATTRFPLLSRSNPKEAVNRTKTSAKARMFFTASKPLGDRKSVGMVAADGRDARRDVHRAPVHNGLKLGLCHSERMGMAARG